MSWPDNTNALDRQLADLQLSKDINSHGKVKKIPPAVPPKKKAQPQVPHSAMVNKLREPSYSTKISPAISNNLPPSNILYTNVRPIHKEYINVNRHSTSQQPLNSTSQVKAENAIYSNVMGYQNNPNNSLPPPPPPLPPLHMTDPILYTTPSFENNTEEYLPPPSPVSSNYSELVRATANLNFHQEKPTYPPIYQNEYPEYGVSQASTYESLYEQINVNTQESVQGKNNNLSHTKSKSPLPKEEEVDALTNLLVQSISDSQDLDIFGMCIKCNEKVVGESSGCTAMGNMYHVKCFCCYQCNTNLQGKPFYAVEGQPYCEVDYYETLEKCSVCNKPILDRILRATGKPYHPTCFTCVVCGKSLDGIPFTVDATNQIHCIEDFQLKFAPRCCVCELPIMPEEGEEETVRVVALDRSFHVRCYRCEDCGLMLSSEAKGHGCYPLDGHILCKTCNAHRIRHLTKVMTTDL
ncbi:unnamed protein product [Parnassius apollo]|uniref:(apollo) hypothetical protein n=1 Tax=Parnassius apollo TaxID=110799 RepID=A0A8S3YC64_PARAO|nr:unnamed protein product [Parnassius apollo]